MNAQTLTGATLVLWLGAAHANQAAATHGDVQGQDWQERRLMNPTPSERRHEAEGQVFIYDGLAYGTVDQAMDRHFDRIENMMFTRVHHPASTPSGPYIEDDGCD